ncbi:hypothetical protein [Acrocarpospora sp. B8E8]|uniref:hypothetical protein n=1 Tax=Acrocarpospora sp. B8E8 TaxID=3153572 RepID=UPI00325D47FB
MPRRVASVSTYRVSGRKTFCTQVPEADVVVTCAAQGEPGPGAEVLHFVLPLDAEGVRIEETWEDGFAAVLIPLAADGTIVTPS